MKDRHITNILTNYFHNTCKGCKAIGMDVSPPCIEMAKTIAREEGISNTQCKFFQADATINPNKLFSGKF